MQCESGCVRAGVRVISVLLNALLDIDAINLH